MSVSATLTDGSSVIVFQTPQGVYYERLDASFHPMGSPTLLGAGNTPFISVAPLSNAGFSFVWDSGVVGAGPVGLTEQDYDRSGALTATSHPGFPPPAAATAFTSDASVLNPDDGRTTTILGDGSYVSAWATQTNGNGQFNLQTYAHDGTPIGPLQTIPGPGALSAVGAITLTPLADHGFAVAHSIFTQHTSTLELAVFGADGRMTQNQFVAGYGPAAVADSIADVAVAGLPDGGVALSWTDVPANSTGSGVGPRMLLEYERSGSSLQTLTAIGSPRTLGTAQINHPANIEVLPDGHYVVTWTAPNGVLQTDVVTEAHFGIGATNQTVTTFDPHLATPNGVVNVVLGAGGLNVTGNFLDNVFFNNRNTGAATISGGAGADTILGGDGADSLTGGAGADVFAFASPPAQAGHVGDFTSGSDRLDITNLFATTGYHGTDPIADGYVNVANDSAGWAVISFDADGKGPGAAVAVTTLDHVAAAAFTTGDLKGFSNASPPPPPASPPPVSPPPADGGRVLVADDSNATLTGGSGADTLVAGHGADVLTGGGGADLFRFPVTPWNAGRVTDFVVGTDHLDFSKLFDGSHYAGSDPVADGYVALRDDGSGGTIVTYDTDGPANGSPWPFTMTDLVNVSPSGLTWATLSGGAATSPPPPVSPPPPPPPPPPSGGQTLVADDSGGSLTGGDGNDTLVAGHGANVLTGGGGADLFRFPVTPWNAGKITDFVVGTDKLDFSTLFADSHYAGSDPVADGYVAFHDDGSGGAIVTYDTDGPASGSPWPFTMTDLVGVSPAGLSWAALAGGAPASPPPPPPPPPPAGGGQVLTSSTNFPGSVMVGGDGADTFNAGQGSDTMTGAGGDDRFVFQVAPWSPAEITDFTHGHDLLDLRGVFASSGYAGRDPVADGYLGFTSDGAGGTKVLVDVDGPGTGQPWPNYIITLDHVAPSSMTASDWIIH